MTDLAAWQVHGSVRTIGKTVADWDQVRGDWRDSRQVADVTFDRGGRATQNTSHNPDGSVTRQDWIYDGDRLVEERTWTNDDVGATRVYSYDASGRCTEIIDIQPDGTRRIAESYRYDELGRKTTLVFLDDMPPGAVTGFGAEAATQGMMTTTTVHDPRASPDTVILHNATGEAVLTFVFSRDDTGRVVREDVYRGAPTAFPMFPSEQIPQGEREELTTLLGAVMPDQTFASVAYEYDSRGRTRTRTTRFTVLQLDRTAFTYDDHDNPILESSYADTNNATFDESGNLQTEPEETRRRDVQFEYKYDDHANWVERIVSIRTDESAPFQRTNVEWRSITYYEGDELPT